MRLARFLGFALMLQFSWALAAAAEGGPPIVQEVVVVGGVTISAETVEYYLGVAQGDPFNAEAIAASFKRFWDSGLVEELTLESEEIEPGKVRLIVTIRERPKVTEFTFEGNKKLSTSTLKEKLDEASISLKRNVPLRSSEVQKIKKAVEDVYGREGYASAVIEPNVEEVGTNLRKVTFKVDEGEKIKIGDIHFDGNEVFSDGTLRRSLKKIKQKSLWRPWGKKLIWSKESWGEDSENLKKIYLNHGYKDILVGEPQVELVARHPEAATQKKKKFSMVVSIPVQEGKQFRIGSLKLKGNTVLPEERLRKLYSEIKLGKTYNYTAVENGSEAVRTLYQARGYIYAYTGQRPVERPDEPGLVDVEIEIYEGDRFRLGRLEFSGNTKTQDKVLRREFRLFEGDWMNMTVFRRSVFKVNQLGYFKLIEDPLEFKFDEQRKLVNVTVKGQEVGRTDIQFGAGYSELDHFFAQFTFNTRNFLGRGENLGVSLVSGSRADSYSVSFSEPYFLDRRMLIGGSLFKQSMELPDYFRDSQGLTAIWGMSVRDFGQLSLVYAYEDVFAKYTVVRYVDPDDITKNPHRRPIPPPYTDMPWPDPFFDEYTGVTSSFTPSFYLDSRDDPFDPNEGTSTFASVRYAGGILGGDFNYVRPEVGYSVFVPWTRRYVVAANVEAGIIVPFKGSEIPVYDRYRLGGERSLRGFGYYTVLPRTADGEYFLTESGARLGGDRKFQLNLEFQIKLGGPLKLIFFSDTGNTWHEDQGWEFSLMRYSVGVEMRIFLPVFQAPLRFIWGNNLKPFSDEDPSDFQFSIGTTF